MDNKQNQYKAIQVFYSGMQFLIMINDSIFQYYFRHWAK